MERIEPGLVSIVIAVFNGERFLEETLRSVLAQTYAPIECVLCDDGSIDGTGAIIRKHMVADPRVNGVFHEANRGVAAATNTAIRASRGEFIALIGADDLWEPNKLTRQVELIRSRPEVGMVATGGYVIDEHGQRLRPIRTDQVRRGRVSLSDMIVEGFPIAAPSVLLRREALEKCGYLDERYRIAEDFELWLRITRDYEVVMVDEPLLLYRCHGGNISKDRLSSIRARLQILEDRIERDPGEMSRLGPKFRRKLQRMYARAGRLHSRKGEKEEALHAFDKALLLALGRWNRLQYRVYRWWFGR